MTEQRTPNSGYVIHDDNGDDSFYSDYQDNWVAADLKDKAAVSPEESFVPGTVVGVVVGEGVGTA